MRVAGLTGGSGSALLLLHGSGPGVSSNANWQKILEPLALRHRVLAIDLIGFGNSARCTAAPYFDFERWVRQARAAIDWLGGGPVAVLGHSISGAIALRLAAQAPGSVASVIGTGTMGTSFPVNIHLERIWRCPRTLDDMRATAASLLFDQTLITATYLSQRMAIIGNEPYRNYFNAMFEGSLEQYVAATALSPEVLRAVVAPVLLVHGRQDPAFPAEDTALILSRQLSQCDVVLLDRCSHSVAYEHPHKLLALINMHLTQSS